MKNLLFVFFTLFVTVTKAQIDYVSQARVDLKKQDSVFKSNREKLTIAKDSLQKLTDNLDNRATSYFNEVVKLKKSNDSLFTIANTSISFYQNKGVPVDSIADYITIPQEYSININSSLEKEPDEKAFLFFGENKVISIDSIIKNQTARQVISDVLNDESETYFGDFWFPKDGQNIPIWKKIKNDKRETKFTLSKIITPKTKGKKVHGYLKFERVFIKIYEGSISDIRVFLKDDFNNIHQFTNHAPISLLKFSKLSGINKLFHTSEQTLKTENYSNTHIIVSDVLRYFYSVNGNFIPNDVEYNFPVVVDGIKTNEEGSNKYEVRQSTALNNILDFRAYTDILGLTDTDPNGVAQFEGRADFFVIPFNVPNYNLYFLKKVQPYILYSRLDEDDRIIRPSIISNSENLQIAEPLELLQRKFIDLGIKLDLLSYKFSKEYPFDASLYAAARYQSTRLQLPDSSRVNYTALGAGGGLEINFKRFENFDLTYHVEFLNYNPDPYNNIETLIDPDPFIVMRNEFEVSYFPAQKRNNSLFLRLRVFDDLNSEEGSNFFQIQLGYKFTFGIGNITSN